MVEEASKKLKRDGKREEAFIILSAQRPETQKTVDDWIERSFPPSKKKSPLQKTLDKETKLWKDANELLLQSLELLKESKPDQKAAGVPYKEACAKFGQLKKKYATIFRRYPEILQHAGMKLLFNHRNETSCKWAKINVGKFKKASKEL